MNSKFVFSSMREISKDIKLSASLKKQLLDESLNSKKSSGMGYEKTIQGLLFNKLLMGSVANNYIVQIERKLSGPKGLKIADLVVKNECQLFSNNSNETGLIIELGHQHLHQKTDLYNKFSDDFIKWNGCDVLHIQIVTAISKVVTGSDIDLTSHEIELDAKSSDRLEAYWDRKEDGLLGGLCDRHKEFNMKTHFISDGDGSSDKGPAVTCLFKLMNESLRLKIWFIITENKGREVQDLPFP